MEEDINIIVNKIKEKDKRKGSDAPKGGCWNPQINLRIPSINTEGKT